MSNNLVLFGSSRSNGKTREAVTKIFDGIAHEFVDLSALSMSHYDYEHTNRDDDFLSVARMMATHSNIFFCTPVYWYSMSAVMKIFFDRMSDLVTIEKPIGRSLKGRKCHLISSGTDDEVPSCFVEPFRRSCDYLDMQLVHTLYYYTGENPAILAKNTAKIMDFRSAIA